MSKCIHYDIEFYLFRDNNCYRSSSRRKPYPLPMGCAYGGEWCLQPIDIAVVDEIMKMLGNGKDLINDWGFSDEFEEKAQRVIALQGLSTDDLGKHPYTKWKFFKLMLPYFE